MNTNYKLKHRHFGISLIGLMFSVLIIGVIAILSFKLFPAYLEQKSVAKTIKKIVNETPYSGNFAADVRKKFDDAGRLTYTKIEGKDLNIDEATVRYSYEHKIPLMANIYLGISFTGSEKAN